VKLPTERKYDFVASIEKAHGRELRRYLAARLRNAAADIPDLMQEVYLRLLRIENFDTVRKPLAYLYTIASHVLQQHSIKQASKFSSFSSADLVLELSANADLDPAAQIEAEQSFEGLERTLRALSPRAYSTLILNRCHGKTLQEIGDNFGVSRAQVKKYLTKALILVRNELRQTAKEAK
jgi:RNA polymerase sigma-70 factor (ECF subfamily)